MSASMFVSVPLIFMLMYTYVFQDAPVIRKRSVYAQEIIRAAPRQTTTDVQKTTPKIVKGNQNIVLAT